MSDLVEQLQLRARFSVAGYREYAVPFDSGLDLRAATRIEQLKAENALLREAVDWLQVVGMSAGWQYMTFETREKISEFLGRAALAGKAVSHD